MNHFEGLNLNPERLSKLIMGNIIIKKSLYCQYKDEVVNGRQHIIVYCPSHHSCSKCLESWLRSEVKE